VKNWGEWEIVRRQVAIGGRVVDGQNNPVAGARVKITAKAGKFKVQAESGAWENLQERPDATVSRVDGTYFFLDLPQGQYTLSAIDPRSGQSAETQATVAKHKEAPGRIAQADLKLSA
jgi:hypothetical protein